LVRGCHIESIKENYLKSKKFLPGTFKEKGKKFSVYL